MTKNVKLNNDTGKQARAQTLNQVFISVCRPIKNNMLHFNWAPSQPVSAINPINSTFTTPLEINWPVEAVSLNPVQQ